jgi:hypothetical protein
MNTTRNTESASAPALATVSAVSAGNPEGAGEGLRCR